MIVDMSFLLRVSASSTSSIGFGFSANLDAPGAILPCII